jgi:hypothetical protein
MGYSGAQDLSALRRRMSQRDAVGQFYFRGLRAGRRALSVSQFAAG